MKDKDYKILVNLPWLEKGKILPGIQERRLRPSRTLRNFNYTPVEFLHIKWLKPTLN
mgnify:CR=1 FL=1